MAGDQQANESGKRFCPAAYRMTMERGRRSSRTLIRSMVGMGLQSGWGIQYERGDDYGDIQWGEKPETHQMAGERLFRIRTRRPRRQT